MEIFFSAHGVPKSYVEEAGDPYKVRAPHPRVPHRLQVTLGSAGGGAGADARAPCRPDAGAAVKKQLPAGRCVCEGLPTPLCTRGSAVPLIKLAAKGVCCGHALELASPVNLAAERNSGLS